MASACDTCLTDNGCKGALVCEECSVPDEWARYPKWRSVTAMSAHNRIRMTCGLCIQRLKEDYRVKRANFI